MEGHTRMFSVFLGVKVERLLDCHSKRQHIQLIDKDAANKGDTIL